MGRRIGLTRCTLSSTRSPDIATHWYKPSHCAGGLPVSGLLPAPALVQCSKSHLGQQVPKEEKVPNHPEMPTPNTASRQQPQRALPLPRERVSREHLPTLGVSLKRKHPQTFSQVRFPPPPLALSGFYGTVRTVPFPASPWAELCTVKA